LIYNVVQNIQILELRIIRFGGDAGFMVKYFLEYVGDVVGYVALSGAEGRLVLN
jgi:hypothetical protein